MKMIRKVAALVGVLALFGCEDITDLEVINQNDPDRARAITSPTDVESLIASSMQQWWDDWEESVPGMSLSSTADEGTMSWGNWASRELSSEPRLPWTNKVTASYQGFTREPWTGSYRALSLVYDGLLAINDPDNPVLIGEGGEDTPRALTFAKFVQGLAHGHVALMFDKGFIIDETVDLEDSLAFFSYQEIMDTAIKFLDMAITMSTNNAFVLPPTWIQGTQYTNIELRGLAKWFKGRYLASVGRNQAERDAADWAMINASYDGGMADLGRDFIIYGEGSWWQRVKGLGQNEGWMRADYKTLCTYETGGTNCDGWYSTPVADRQEFQFQSPDARIMGATPTTNGTDINWKGPSPFYASRGTYHFSEYFYYRYNWYYPGYLGDIPYITVDEIGLRKAEALLRMGGAVTQTIVDLINDTRDTRGGLTPLTTANSAAETWAALQHEKRMEFFHLASSMAYFDKRGYPLVNTQNRGHGLVEGSACHYPIPSNELELLELPTYTFGGVGTECSSGGPVSGAFASARVPFRDVYWFDGLETIAEKLDLVRDEASELDPGVQQLTRY